MKRLQAYKYALKTTPALEHQLLRFAGSCRFVWNRMLDLQKQRLDAGEPVLRYNKSALFVGRGGWGEDGRLKKRRLTQKKKITRLHQRIANVRTDFLHKTSTTISKNHAVVVLEDLRIKNMSASARGTKEQPGKNVNQKRGLNRSILDQGWFEFRRQLDYKQQWAGGLVIAVSRAATPVRTCPDAVTSPPTTARRKRNSSASNADTRSMPTWLRRRTFWRQGMPCQPVERGCSQTALRSRNPPRAFAMLRSLVGIPFSSGRGGCQHFCCPPNLCGPNLFGCNGLAHLL